MARSDKAIATNSIVTITGTPASQVTDLEHLRRSVLTCMLWEDQAYESGSNIANRISELVTKCSPTDVATVAYEARWNMNLRHIPLYLMVRLAKNKTLKAKWLTQVIGRVDELAEFLSLYWKDGRCSISHQVKIGLRDTFSKFDAFQLAKYQGRDRKIKLRDVMRLVHPVPISQDRSLLYKKIVNGELVAPETWESRLSRGANKCEVFTDLIDQNKLGSLAMLRNLRGMQDAGVEDSVIKLGLNNMKTDRLLPFNFLAAVKYAPKFSRELEQAMFRSLADTPKLRGKTVVLVDVSGSMEARLSSKSELTRLTAASAIAMLLKEVTDECIVYATGSNDYNHIHHTEPVPNYRGFALKDSIENCARTFGGGGIFFKSCVEYVGAREKNVDRVIVITDECDTSGIKYNPQETKTFGKLNYVINIASAENGIAYNKFHHINGFSESCIQYITAWESNLVR